MSPRSTRSSKLLAAGAVLALVLVASLAVLVIDAYPTTDPLQRDFIRPGDAPLPKPGLLYVNMSSDQNFSSIVATPYASQVPVSRWPIEVETINSSVLSVAPISLATDTDGFATATLLPGLYLLSAPYNTLDIAIPFMIYSGNTTTVVLNVSESAYTLLYSEAQDVAGQASAYVEVRASTTVAHVGDLLTIGATEGGSQYQAKASVVTQWPPAGGTEWLKVEPEGIFDISSATSADLATWSYSSSVSVVPTPVSVGLEA